MAIIRAEFAAEFAFGDDVVLLIMDGAGLALVAAALTDAERHGAAQLEHDGVAHEFIIQTDAADVDMDDSRVIWRLDPAKAVEIGEDLDALISGDRPGHHYVNIYQPTDTLVLSRDEYVRQS